MEKELLRDIGIATLVILVLFSAAVVLFFAEGGEIRGFNHDPNNPVVSLEHRELVIEVIDTEIAPIYDGTEIKTVELWELPPKEIIRQLIIAPTAYIPPITAQLITIFISCLGLGFIILYHRNAGRKQLEGSSYPEKILAYITENPGQSTQQIADGTDIPRSSLRYHLRRMWDKKQISETEYRGNPYYFSNEKSYTDTEKLVLAVFSRESEKPVFIELFRHPEITRRELADHLHLNEITANWYLNRLNAAKLLTVNDDELQNRYQLTGEAEEACRKFLSNETAAKV